ncbi:ABC transporter ATP-binding protein [Vulcanimicrobium alpinum]|uniref:ABC transporter ATP-binding protein n=1 Tax=Vulcanimicrobium alpinum TaxID=3016050 RepID=A0AAN2C8U5_UNVUL|nr:DUF302 domain-containing protein [Vulcanimicrobium alpinum]BDE05639.1 ABC transporter ATP-binding protein [Vulcanimicrobium alpinum]
MNITSLPYGNSTEVALDVPAAIARAKELLAEQGFGVLCEIDVAATLRAKLGAEIGEYVILGACRPDAARTALAAEPDLGLLLPCNVLVRRAQGRTTVGVIDAGAMLGIVGNDALAPLAADINGRLAAVLRGFERAAAH